MHLRLRAATSALHRRVEEQVELGSAVTRERYRDVLRAFYGYYEPLEPRVAAVAAAAPPEGFEVVARAPLLARDLLALGDSPAVLTTMPRCSDLPRLGATAELAGCLYVLEGAALGAQVVRRILELRLGIARDNGGSFFTGGGPRTGGRWERVLAWIERVGAEPNGSEAMVNSACETFLTMSRWLESRRMSA
jgi:heme oxygenase (biliverdin-IX-beta and delta-forming)